MGEIVVLQKMVEDTCFGCEYEEVCPLEHGIYICLKDKAAKKKE